MRVFRDFGPFAGRFLLTEVRSFVEIGGVVFRPNDRGPPGCVEVARVRPRTFILPQNSKIHRKNRGKMVKLEFFRIFENPLADSIVYWVTY